MTALQVERDGSLLILTLDRPQVRNAVNRKMAEQVAEAIAELEGDADLRCGVITGAGGTFCSGMDLSAYLDGDLPVATGGFAGLVEAVRRKPLIAAVEGYAVAGGFEIALACEMIVAAENAVFGLPEVSRGLVAGGGGLFRLAERIPRNEAMRLALTGASLDVGRAYELGLVSRIVAVGAALEAARELGEQIVANAPGAVALSQRIVDESRFWPSDERFERQAVLTEGVLESAEATDGARAFTERRAPRWTSS